MWVCVPVFNFIILNYFVSLSQSNMNTFKLKRFAIIKFGPLFGFNLRTTFGFNRQLNLTKTYLTFGSRHIYWRILFSEKLYVIVI